MRYESYVNAWRRRKARQEQRQQKRRQKVMARVKAVGDMLKKRYGIEKAWVFGSIAYKERLFRSDSDVDIAVEGLDASEFYNAWRDAEDMLERSVDLVDMSDVSDGMKEIIREHGEVIGND